jgi:hypothetical protein
VCGERREGRGALGVERHGAVRVVVRVRAHALLEPLAQRRLALAAERVVAGHALALGPAVEDERALAVEPVGAPVRRDVGAVAPDGPHLLAADRLPDVLPAADVVAGQHDPATGRDHALGDGRRRCLDAGGVGTDDDKSTSSHGEERDPVRTVGHS